MLASIGEIGVAEPPDPFRSQFPCPTVDTVTCAIGLLANAKAVGNDLFPSELLQAAREPFALLCYAPFRHIWHKAYVPLMWRGGRLAELFEKIQR